MDELLELTGPAMTPGTVYIDVWSCRARVARYVALGRAITNQVAANWEELEVDATMEVEHQGGGITLSGHYPCPGWLAGMAEWEEEG